MDVSGKEIMNSEKCYEIRKKHDEKYENLFYIGVWSRGEFCRVTCPKPLPPRKEDMTYFHNIYEAFEAGLLPCPDCEPDMYSEMITLNINLSNVVNNALRMIAEGYLNTHTLNQLAQRLYVSERHLRRLFHEETGMSPIKIAEYHKIIFAKKLLYETSMKITDIAFASGFNSLRQFNYSFKKIYKQTPSMIRKDIEEKNQEDQYIYISYHKGFDFEEALNELKENIVTSVEKIEDQCYIRTFNLNHVSGIVKIKDLKEENKLKVKIITDDRRVYMAVYYKIQRMFGVLNIHLKHVLGFNPFQTALSIILTDAGYENVTEIMNEIVEACGKDSKYQKYGLKRVFPTFERFQQCDLQKINIQDSVKNILKEFNERLLENKIVISYNQSYEKFYQDMKEMKGLQDATIDRIAEKALGLSKNQATMQTLQSP